MWYIKNMYFYVKLYKKNNESSKIDLSLWLREKKLILYNTIVYCMIILLKHLSFGKEFGVNY